MNEFKNIIKGKSILLTGGTGSFGNKFVSLILDKLKPKKLVIFSRDELKQFNMLESFPYSKYKNIRFFLGDVRDQERLNYAMENIDYVIHAAALKHVSIAEYNPLEFINTNIVGTNNVIKSAINNNVSKVILLSTDKAVNPINLYGSTKLCAEKLMVAANNIVGSKKTIFSVVRYGNVLASRGSVIEKLINHDIKKKFPVTHEEMTRFWIYLDDAVKFVLQSLKNMQGGEIFIPKMSSMKLEKMIKLIIPNIKIELTGIRPGEKLHEKLISIDDAKNTYEFKNCFITYPNIRINRQNLNKVKNFENKLGKIVNKDFSYTSEECKDRLKIFSRSKIATLINR
jgi:UDP-N-acetylglucosamine 4,6-dehydratase/5-epimerase